MISQLSDDRNHPASPSSGAALQFKRDFVALIPQLCAFSRRLCRSHEFADDMAQEALAKAWRARDQFKPGTSLKAWLFTILRNQVYSEARRAWRKIQWDEERGKRIPAPAGQQEHAMDVSDTEHAEISQWSTP
jgi:RNA polymerase sigma-70 factor, ECF subfamily